MKALIAITAALSLSGCAIAPTVWRTELEHVSHPSAGWPVSAADTEDGLTQVNLVARWESGSVYVESGLGYNLQGVDGGGFYGPALTYTGRVGVEFGRR